MTGTRSTVARASADPRRTAPRLVLGLAPSPLADAVASHFHELGWEVTRADSGVEAGWHAHRSKPTALVLNTDYPPESGHLICAKVRLTSPACRVVLVGPDDAAAARRARYAGAVGYLPESAGVGAVAMAVLGT